nr:hypothetical protein [Saccharopolyspora gloriosae]
MAQDLERSTTALADSATAPEADAGPSGPAVHTTLGELIRAAAGLAEDTSRTVDDLHTGKATYTDIDANNADQFHQISPR